MQHKPLPYSAGFSLVELSIVLVILGLLVGGVLGGQALIRSSELRNIALERDKLTSALNIFKNKYQGMPGDITNATAFWGAAHATPATCYTTAGTGTQTCDGDGNGRIGVNTEPAQPTNEWWRSLQQLANAGLIEGTYSGVAGPGGPRNAIVGTNATKSKAGSAGWTLLYNPTYNAGDSPYVFASTMKHFLLFGGTSSASSDDLNWKPELTTEEMWGIDTKLDDGKPGLGNIITYTVNSYPCATTDVANTAVYDFAQKSNQCVPWFKTGM